MKRGLAVKEARDLSLTAHGYTHATAKEAKYLRKAVAFRHLLDATFMFAKLEQLPEDFSAAFLRLLGHTLCPGKTSECAGEITADLLTLTEGPENVAALATWHRAEKLLPDADPRHACYAMLQKLPDVNRAPNYLTALRSELLRNWERSLMDLIPTHLTAAGSIAAGGALCHAGTMFLINAPGAADGGESLWLVKRRRNGVFTVAPPPKEERIRVSEIKQLQAYVRGYTGPPLWGCLRFMSAGLSERLCRIVGLEIRDKHAWLLPNQEVTA